MTRQRAGIGQPAAVHPQIVITAEQVADQFDEFVSFGERFARELGLIAAARVPLSVGTANRLTALVAIMRRADEIRRALAGMDARRLLDGVTVWTNRQRPQPAGSAAGRAALIWRAGHLAEDGTA